jgi:hypothetical protein
MLGVPSALASAHNSGKFGRSPLSSGYMPSPPATWRCHDMRTNIRVYLPISRSLSLQRGTHFLSNHVSNSSAVSTHNMNNDATTARTYTHVKVDNDRDRSHHAAFTFALLKTHIWATTSSVSATVTIYARFVDLIGLPPRALCHS